MHIIMTLDYTAKLLSQMILLIYNDTNKVVARMTPSQTEVELVRIMKNETKWKLIRNCLFCTWFILLHYY